MVGWFREEEMLGVKDCILNGQYEEALSDVKYSFLVKLYLRFLLANDSDERPDFIMAKRVFNQIFMSLSDTSELNDTLEATLNLDSCNCDIILDSINIHHSETKSKSINDTCSGTPIDYDTPKPTDPIKHRSKSHKNLMNSNRKSNLDDYSDTIMPLKLDEKFSDCLDINEEPCHKSKVTEFLEKATESTPRILPVS